MSLSLNEVLAVMEKVTFEDSDAKRLATKIAWGWNQNTFEAKYTPFWRTDGALLRSFGNLWVLTGSQKDPVFRLAPEVWQRLGLDDPHGKPSRGSSRVKITFTEVDHTASLEGLGNASEAAVSSTKKSGRTPKEKHNPVPLATPHRRDDGDFTSAADIKSFIESLDWKDYNDKRAAQVIAETYDESKGYSTGFAQEHHPKPYQLMQVWRTGNQSDGSGYHYYPTKYAVRYIEHDLAGDGIAFFG